MHEPADSALIEAPAPGGLSALRRQPWIGAALFAIVLLSSFVLRLNNLGHLGIRALDESFHAVVAQNLLRDPLRPMLIRTPYLEYDRSDWMHNHVWLHKPILPLWTMALGIKLLGHEPIAFRLPSAVMMTVAAFLTYLIGTRLWNRWVGLIACTLISFSPATYTLVHGYIFSDHIDIAFLMWTTAGVYYVVRTMQTGRAHDAFLAGVMQGLSILSKSFPGLIVLGLVLSAWLLPRLLQSDPSARGWRGIRVTQFLAGMCLVVLPWYAWSAWQFPVEFWWEQKHQLLHLTEDIETWAGPWDRVIFDYALRLQFLFFPASVTALVFALWQGISRRDARLLIVALWLLGVILPFTLATSKTPTATLIAMPAWALLIGWATAESLRGERSLAVAMSVSLLGGALIPQGWFPVTGMGYVETNRLWGVLQQNQWSAWLILASILAGVIGTQVRLRSRAIDRQLSTWLCVFVVAGLVWCTIRSGYVGYRVTALNVNAPSFREIGRWARAQPDNVVFFVDERQKFDHKLVMYWTDRVAYGRDDTRWSADLRRVRDGGGVAYLVTDRETPGEPVVRQPDGRAVYRIE